MWPTWSVSINHCIAAYLKSPSENGAGLSSGFTCTKWLSTWDCSFTFATASWHLAFASSGIINRKPADLHQCQYKPWLGDGWVVIWEVEGAWYLMFWGHVPSKCCMHIYKDCVNFIATISPISAIIRSEPADKWIVLILTHMSCITAILSCPPWHVLQAQKSAQCRLLDSCFCFCFPLSGTWIPTKTVTTFVNIVPHNNKNTAGTSHSMAVLNKLSSRNSKRWVNAERWFSYFKRTGDHFKLPEPYVTGHVLWLYIAETIMKLVKN